MKFEDLPQNRRLTMSEILSKYNHLYKHAEPAQKMIEKVLHETKEASSSPMVSMKVLGMHFLNICERLDKVIEILSNETNTVSVSYKSESCSEEIKKSLAMPKTLRSLQDELSAFKPTTVKLKLYEMVKMGIVKKSGDKKEKVYGL